MSRSRSQSRLQPFVVPDVTPLVDLTFLLLIVFMITAPTLEHALNVTPPELSARTIQPKEHIVINVDRSGELYLGDKKTSKITLQQFLAERFDQNRELQVFLRADESRQYGEVMGVMRLIQNTGVTDVSLVTNAESEQK